MPQTHRERSISAGRRGCRARDVSRYVCGGWGGGSPRGSTLPIRAIRTKELTASRLYMQVAKMEEEEQSSESDGYYTPEEEPVCSKPEGSFAQTEVSIMEGTIAELIKA